MNKLLLLLILSSVLSGCSSNKYKDILLKHPEYPVIESTCDNKCIKNIEKILGISEDDYSTASISYAVIQKIDEIPGDVEFGGTIMYNSYWDASFEIPLKPGRHLFNIGPSYMPDKDPYVFSIEFELEQSHKYFIGHYLVGPTHIRNWNYKWFAIIYDKTNNKIIFPLNDIPWQGKNIRNMQIPHIVPVK